MYATITDIAINRFHADFVKPTNDETGYQHTAAFPNYILATLFAKYLLSINYQPMSNYRHVSF